jgi:hypothetical protein
MQGIATSTNYWRCCKAAGLNSPTSVVQKSAQRGSTWSASALPSRTIYRRVDIATENESVDEESDRCIRDESYSVGESRRRENK